MWVYRVRAFPVAATSCFPGQYRLSSGLSQLCCTSPSNIVKAVNPISLPEVWSWNLSPSTQPYSLWVQDCKLLLYWELLFGNNPCGEFSVLPMEYLFLHSSLRFQSSPLFPNVKGFLSVWKPFLLPDSLPGCRSPSWNPLSLFSSLSLPYQIYPFHYMGLECKSRKSRNTRSNRKIWPWSLEWSRAKVNRVLPREYTGHSKNRLPTMQEKTLHLDNTRWSTPKLDWLYSLQPKMEKLYTVNKNKTGSWLWLRSWTPYCQIQT